MILDEGIKEYAKYVAEAYVKKRGIFFILICLNNKMFMFNYN